MKFNVKDYCFYLNPFENSVLLYLKKLGVITEDFRIPCEEFITIKGLERVCIPSDGNFDSKLMIIGQNPGKTEYEKEKPFVGPSGQLLWECFNELGYKREDFYITNAMKCFLETEEIKSDYLKTCACSILLRELVHIKPERILLLGEKALQGFFYALNLPLSKTKQIERNKVYQFDLTALGIGKVKVVYTYHPSYILRNIQENPQYWKKEFMQGLGVFLQDHRDLSKSKEKIFFIKEREDFEKVLFPKLKEEIEKGNPIVLDLELLNVEVFDKKNKVIAIGLGFSDGSSCVIQCLNVGIGGKVEYQNLDLIKKTLTEYLTKAKIIGHNVKFDIVAIYYLLGVDLQENVYMDTICMYHLLNEKGPFGLKELASIYSDFGKDYAKEINEVLKKHKDKWIYYIPMDKILEYCGIDCLVTYDLYKQFVKKIQKEDEVIAEANKSMEKMIKVNLQQKRVAPIINYRVSSLQSLLNYVMKHYKLIIEMEKNGLPFDLAYISQVKETVKSNLRDLEQKLQEEAKLSQNINWNSTKQVKEVFLSLGYKSSIKTPKGDYSYSEEALKKLADEGVKLAQLLLEYRKLQKALTTYLNIPEEYRELMRDVEGDEMLKRLSCKIKVHGTETGRLSTSDPSFHTIPRDNLYRQMIRAEKGWLIVSADYSMADLRMIAGYSNCQSMLNDFASGVDFHTLQASKIFKKSVEEITKEERSIAKSINFAIAYQASDVGIAKMLNIPVELAKHYIDSWFSDKKEVVAWVNMIRDYYSKFPDGSYVYFWNIYGRIRRILKVSKSNRSEYEHHLREAINFFPQSSVADTLMIALLRLEKFLKERGLKDKVRYLLTIHDAILLEVKEEVVEEVAGLIKKAMEFPIPFAYHNLVIPVDVTINERWIKE